MPRSRRLVELEDVVAAHDEGSSVARVAIPTMSWRTPLDR